MLTEGAQFENVVRVALVSDGCLACVDGYDAAAFIQRVKGMLEHQASLFIER
jgi:hypothetical protein